MVTFKNTTPANEPDLQLDIVGHSPKAQFPKGMVGLEARKDDELILVGFFGADALASAISKLIETGETIWGDSMKAELTKHGIAIKPVK
jgi:hypothetical protein